jgi:hypothetical protein
MRKKGYSLRDIESKLRIPRSTLSGWFQTVLLTTTQKKRLSQSHLEGLATARKLATARHKENKTHRLKVLEQDALDMVKTISRSDRTSLEIALAFLYLGEGAKSGRTALGSSNPDILRFFIYGITTLYEMDRTKIKCALHLRADQNPEELKEYWSNALDLPITNFTKASIDARTAGRATYPHYKGVCLLECGRVEIQRRLMYIANAFCRKFQEGNMRA